MQEWYGFSETIREVFPGCPELKGGYIYLNEGTGLGIDIDEKLAAKYLCTNRLPEWTLARTPDGTSARP
ncbi:hypothetical protein [Paenibacillus sedimenti]|uniref:hypothetical protein n=1 Tax=Paenibacillus sedimenti TaxID=2770274 RepID=UPI001CB70E79|nr:hypothetical protein [Paenibacillus sedimenti]